MIFQLCIKYIRIFPTQTWENFDKRHIILGEDLIIHLKNYFHLNSFLQNKFLLRFSFLRLKNFLFFPPSPTTFPVFSQSSPTRPLLLFQPHESLQGPSICSLNPKKSLFSRSRIFLYSESNFPPELNLSIYSILQYYFIPHKWSSLTGRNLLKISHLHQVHLAPRSLDKILLCMSLV